MTEAPGAGDDGRAATSGALLEALRARLATEGLFIALPLGRAGFDAACAGVGLPPLGALLPGGAGGDAGAVVIGDGGPGFFARFEAARAAAGVAGANPLDRYTRQRVEEAVADVVSARGLSHRTLYPFVDERPALPFQRLGQAAGLPPPGPLGLQIHERFGPWWAYRALVLLPVALEAEPPLARPCQGCPAPCIAACPVGAPAASGFDVDRCLSRRRADPACRLSCAARSACPAGLGARYPDRQLAFHMAASLGLPPPA